MDYNPYCVKTKLQIEGSTDDPRIAQFANVLDYPLQVWLCERMDWPGLSQKLRIFSRGETILLTFRGRATDFNDLNASLTGTEDYLVIEYEQAYEVFEDENITKELDILRLYPDFQANQAGVLSLINQATDQSYVEEIVIADEDDYQNAKSVIQKQMTPCLISANVFLKHSDEIDGMITGDFTRPYDSVYIVVENERDTELFSDQIKKGIRVGKGSPKELTELTEKYATVSQRSWLWKKLVDIRNELSQQAVAVNERIALFMNGESEEDDEIINQLLKWKNWYE